MSTSIEIGVSAGTSIERACEDAHMVANRLGIDCEFRFNDVRCIAVPQGSVALLVERQQREQARRPKHRWDLKFASSDPRTQDRQARAEGIAQPDSDPPTHSERN